MTPSPVVAAITGASPRAAPTASRTAPVGLENTRKMGSSWVRVARRRRRRSSKGAVRIRSWGSTTPSSKSWRRMAASTPARTAPVPSGRVKRWVMAKSAGSASRVSTPSVIQLARRSAAAA